MFDQVAKHKRIAQIVIALIALPFAFFGVDSYFRNTENVGEVATFNGGKITQAEFAQSVREQQEMLLRTQRGVDPAILDNPEVRFNILQQLIRERLLEKKGNDLHFGVSNSQIFDRITSDARFRDGDRFSLERYKQLLAQAGIPEAGYEEGIRKQLLAEKLVDPIARGSIVARASGEGFVNLLEQQREVSAARIDAERFVKDLRIDDAAVKAFYEANQDAFRTPEEMKFEYLVLTPEALLSQVAMTPEEVKAQYASNMKQYAQDEQRQAAHILIAIKPDAKDAEKAAAKRKAEEVYAKAKANPAKFGEFAKQFSEDPGSAGQGGDLGSNPRGTMVKAFDDVVFAMRPGEIAPPVQSEFGWHVIKLNGITSAKTRSFEESKVQIENDLLRQKVAQKFAGAADQFQNLVYEQADTLSGAAKALKLNVQTSGLVTRADAQKLAFGNPKLVQALFSPESISGRRNTEAIEVGPNTLMAGRVVEYKPAASRPYDDVKDEVRRQLLRKAASEMAQKVGRDKLAVLERAGSDKEAGVSFDKPVLVLRNQMQPGFSPEALTRVFQLDAGKLPRFVGMTNERGGFSIYKVTKVIAPPVADPAKLAAASARVGELQSREVFDAYIATLKSKADVKVNQDALEKK